MAEHALQITIHQGIYHQVKRMLAAVGNKVEKLHRQQVGALNLNDLALDVGEWMYLSPEQVELAKSRME